ncbi:MAG TPA: hypothetical protein VN745_09750 [Verrucomicrobiae bacterium]|nr:hypothetical protein [Verrucomicrobiae bacterium]
MKRNTRVFTLRRVLVLSVLPLVAIALAVLVYASPAQQNADPQLPPQASSEAALHAEAHDPVQFDVSPPLRDMPFEAPVAHAARLMPEEEMPEAKRNLKKIIHRGEPFDDPVLQTSDESLVEATKTISAESLTLKGTALDCSDEAAPADANLAVGDTEIVQWVNLCYAVFSKSTGAALAGPFPGNHFWSGFGGPCQYQNSGDPVVLYDKMAHRWFASQNTFKAPYMTCIAVSVTSDARGSYYRYAFPQKAGFPDYPKWGVWRDGYYQHNNVFGGTVGFASEACAYDRAKMLVGNSTAKQICFLAPTSFDDSLLPADIDSPNDLPPAGEPEMYLGTISNSSISDVIYEYLFHANFTTPSLSTFKGFSGTMPIFVPQFKLSCNGAGDADCIPQRGTSYKLASEGDRLMYRLAYRNFGSHQSWVVAHDVTASSGHVAERWYEFRASETSTRPTVYQAGTFAGPSGNTNNRWMGSIAMDKVGDIALGFSVSGTGTYPSIHYTGRTPSMTKGVMGAEDVIQAGGGSQIGTGGRWGDYTSMALDPNGCTFWYTNEYYLSTSSFNWRTRIGSIKFPNCN